MLQLLHALLALLHLRLEPLHLLAMRIVVVAKALQQTPLALVCVAQLLGQVSDVLHNAANQGQHRIRLGRREELAACQESSSQLRWASRPVRARLGPSAEEAGRAAWSRPVR